MPLVQTWQQAGDVEAYARDYVEFFRAFTEAPLAAALAGQPDSAGLIEAVLATAETLLRADPGRYPFRHVAVAMLQERRAV